MRARPTPQHQNEHVNSFEYSILTTMYHPSLRSSYRAVKHASTCSLPSSIPLIVHASLVLFPYPPRKKQGNSGFALITLLCLSPMPPSYPRRKNKKTKCVINKQPTLLDAFASLSFAILCRCVGMLMKGSEERSHPLSTVWERKGMKEKSKREKGITSEIMLRSTPLCFAMQEGRCMMQAVFAPGLLDIVGVVSRRDSSLCRTHAW
jgi:hypothetical protein